MKQEAINKLRALDRAFYDDCAETFSSTRQSPWSGFERLVRHAASPSRVLDVGCGNGRFARALGSADVASYLGVDASAALLRQAQTQQLPFTADFRLGDILDSEPPWVEERFDLIVVLGVMHHIPGASLRRRFLHGLGRCLSKNGILAVSFYRHERSARMVGRALLPGAAGTPNIASNDLEPGDRFIPFGNTGRLRYCHQFDDDELERLSSLEALELVDRFAPTEGSDKLNDYMVYRRPSSAVACE